MGELQMSHEKNRGLSINHTRLLSRDPYNGFIIIPTQLGRIIPIP